MTKSRLFFTLFSLTIIYLIFYRSPCFFFQEGFWQINNTHFFRYSLNNTILDSILYVYPFGSYFELTINIATTIGSYLPEYSILIDVLLAFLIKLIIIFYVYFSKNLIFKNLNYRVIIIFLVLFSPPMTPEIWLTTLHAKAYFGIFSFLLLFQDTKNFKNYEFFFYRFALLFSGLSSIYASVLSPIFFLKYLIEKKKNDLINFFYSFLPLLVNFILFIKFFFQETNLSRFSFDLGLVESFSYNILVRPIFGSSLTKFLVQNFNLDIFSILTLSVTVILIFFIFLFYKVFKLKDQSINLILIAFLLHSIFVLFGSLYDDFVGGRYAVIPGFILLIFFVRLIQIEKNILLNYTYMFIILISLSIGFLEFKYLTPLPNILECRL